MFSKVISCAVFGVEGRIITVEADMNDGLPVFSMVGYLSSSVKEAAERVRTALKNSGFHLPPKRITVNLSPADLRKEGSGFDLAIAVSVLLSSGFQSVIDLNKTVILGELSLDGSMKAIRGILPMVHHCYNQGIKTCMVPLQNAKEASLVPGLTVLGVESLGEAVEIIQGFKEPPVYRLDDRDRKLSRGSDVDFNDVKGQDTLKRGLEIAAAGFHNVLLTGSAGAGKSMLVRRLPTIMPQMTYRESVEVTQIYSVGGMLDATDGLVRIRPFRAPHHTISDKALIGGGNVPRPGEVSFSHHGVLFLDELPEFQRNVLEVLRQPLEDKKVTISRVNGTYVFPADFMLVAAMNPCPCGYFPDRKRCKCSELQIRRYQTKVSGPLLDRMDITMEVKPVLKEELFGKESMESSADIRARVERAIALQKSRYKDTGLLFNSQLDARQVRYYLTLGDKEERFLKDAFQTRELSARGLHKVIKLARTISDLSGDEKIEIVHLQEALFFRNTGIY